MFVTALDNREACGEDHQAVTANVGFPDANTLIGRVVDESSRPIANVLIKATPLKSRGMHQALVITARTVESGRYTFSGTIADEEYLLEFHKGGFAYRTDKAMSGKQQGALTTLDSLRTHQLSGKITDHGTSNVVSEAQVVLIGAHEYNATVLSTADGRFRFDDVPSNIGQGVLFAKKEQDRSALLLVRDGSANVDLTLIDSGRIQGTVVSEATGNPIGGCVVTVRTDFVSGYSVETMTGEDGKYDIGGLPQGAYLVFGRHSEWFCPPNRLDLPAVEVRPGKTEIYEIKMLKKATVFGRVLGPQNQPVFGATVAVPTAMKRYYGQLFDVTKTDRTGRFKLRTAWLARFESHSRPTISAVADGLGAGSVSISGLKEGEIRRQSEQEGAIRLGGVMRVHGHVKDPNGNPIPGVYVYVNPGLWPSSMTDKTGYFDLTSFPLPRHEEFPIYFQAGRPHNGERSLLVSTDVRKPAQIPKAGAQYYLHDKAHVAAEHNGELRLDQTLAPTDLLTLTGQVRDSAGKRYLYRAVVRRRDCIRQESRSFVDRVFGGAAAPALMHLVRDSKLTDDELAELRRLLDRKESKS